ncbi:methyltransferase [Pleurostoma richardsiae]|uniref:Methyltransferase n=1 Tax=Pleurostoma richardsiae TaxID=41990 RepID=A0AA38R355_9PEZI|nr:methyltransferase [Pleurostoma richardsiae]
MAENTAANAGSLGAEPTGTGPSTVLPAEHWTQAAANVHDDDGDTDSTYSVGDNLSSTASLSSSILRYREINGRTYHAERGGAQYWASNDEQQNESMDINHHLLLLSLGNKLHLAPLKKDIAKALDIGTGTGMWAIDFADESPGTEVIGTDISPIQPNWVPPNVKFEIEDCTQEWTFKDDSVDYVHLRYLYGSIPDWDALFREAYRVCKPGGWVESYEASARMECDDGTVGDKSAINEWGKFFIEGGRKLGRTFTIIDDDLQEKGIRTAGFTDIQKWDFKAPIGAWPKDPKLKEVGQYAQLALEQDYEGYVLFMANLVAGWTRQEVTVYCAQLRREIRSTKNHPFYRQRVVWARKPE